jgi:outer membrane lipoprotein-sorting protein
VLALAVVLLSTRLCFGWADNWEDLRAAAGKISSVSATFVQEKHMKVLVKPLISKGVLFFRAPDSLRWEYRYPIKSILIAYNGRTRKYIRKGGTIIEDAGAGAPALPFVIEEISRWLKGRFDENPAFSAGLKTDRKIELTPKNKNLAMMIQRIELNLSERPGIIESVVIYEGENSFTRLKFVNVELNQTLDDALFKGIQ